MNVTDILKQYSRIVVTGCQRSGTTITSQMIACDLQYRYIDENEHGIDVWPRFTESLESENVVVHAPALAHLIQFIRKPNTIIVWVNRPFEEIRNSINRINWIPSEVKEKRKYVIYDLSEELKSQPIEKLKVEVWNQIQKPIMFSPYIEIDYHSDYVRKHSLFIPDDRRVNFTSRQTGL